MSISTGKRARKGRGTVTSVPPEAIPGMPELLARMAANPMRVSFTPEAVAIMRGLAATPPLPQAAE